MTNTDVRQTAVEVANLAAHEGSTKLMAAYMVALCMEGKPQLAKSMAGWLSSMSGAPVYDFCGSIDKVVSAIDAIRTASRG